MIMAQELSEDMGGGTGGVPVDSPGVLFKLSSYSNGEYFLRF